MNRNVDMTYYILLHPQCQPFIDKFLFKKKPQCCVCEFLVDWFCLHLSFDYLIHCIHCEWETASMTSGEKKSSNIPSPILTISMWFLRRYTARWKITRSHVNGWINGIPKRVRGTYTDFTSFSYFVDFGCVCLSVEHSAVLSDRILYCWIRPVIFTWVTRIR